MQKNNKKLIVFCDGTWNKPDEKDKNGKACPTNVSKLFRATCATDDSENLQIVRYIQGVGTHKDDKVRGGAFGMGISSNITDGYQFICSNYTPGDQIFLFGFSRGAYTARSLAGLIYNMGILKREHFDKIDMAYEKYRDRSEAWHPSRNKNNEAKAFRDAFTYGNEKIYFIGVWDTVGALGAPFGLVLGWLIDKIFKCRFHDTELSPIIESGYHALATDEKRWPFRPSLWTLPKNHDENNFEQKWFPGVHCDVGGGYADSGLADITLKWMAEHAAKSGMKIDFSMLDQPDMTLKQHDSQKFYYRWPTLLIIKWPSMLFLEWPAKLFKTWPDTFFKLLNRYGIIAEPDMAEKIAKIDFRGDYSRLG